MNAATYGSQLRAIESDTFAIVSQCQLYLKTSMPTTRLFFYTLKLYILSRRMLRRIDRLDKAECGTCSASTECRLSVKQFQADVVKCMRAMTSHDKEASSVIRKINRDILDRYEDKLENYWIASDGEIKGLVSELSDKLTQRHAH
jgi:hypothetical protein